MNLCANLRRQIMNRPKVKVKFNLEHDRKAQRGSKSVDLLFL